MQIQKWLDAQPSRRLYAWHGLKRFKESQWQKPADDWLAAPV
jgi:hypothetical protein